MMPRWYIPLGVSLPPHLPIAAGVPCLDGHGPDVAAGGPGGGITIGEPYQDAEAAAGWERTAAGWWVRMADVLPQDCLRLDQHPRVVRWHDQAGDRGQWWRVPVLLTPVQAGADDKGYISATERVYRRGGWTDPDDIAAVQVDLRALTTGALPGDQLLSLVERIIAIGYHLTRHELAAAGWLTERLQARICFLACDRSDLADEV